MARIPNTFAAQTPIGQAISNFGAALFSGPTPLEQETAAADLEYRRALTEAAKADALAKQREAMGYTDWASLMDSLSQPQEQPRADVALVGPMPAMSREQQLQAAMPDLLTAAMQIDPNSVGAIARAVMANLGGSDDQMVRGLVGAGQTLGVDDAVSLQGQQNVADRNQGYDIELNTADNIAAAARQAMADEAAMARHLMTPAEVSAGGTMIFNQNDPRAQTAGSVVRGTPTLATEQGAAFANLPPEQQALAVGPTESEVNARTIQGLPPEDQRIAAIGRDPSDTTTPITVSGGDLTDAWVGIASLFEGGVDDEGVPSEDFWAAVGSKRQAVEEAVAAELQRTRDLAQAQRAGLAALGIADPSTIEGDVWEGGESRFTAPAAPAETPAQPAAAPVQDGGTVIQNGWIYRRQGDQMVPVGPVS